MREVVIRGIVEVMNERQMEERARSLHDAVGRMSEARARRGADVVLADLAEPSLLDAATTRRRRMFGFADRARAAVHARRLDA